jgi:hypothetical protein
MPLALWRAIHRLARLRRLRTAALVALAVLPVGAAARTDQAGAELVSWLASWALVAFCAAYAALVLCALLAPDAPPPGRGPTGDRRRR